MEKEIKIDVPEGYEIDKENSTFECIKFKPIIKRWRDKEEPMSGYWIDINSSINRVTFCNNIKENRNVFATEKQAKSALAMAQITQIMVNDERFGGLVTDEEWDDGENCKFVIVRINNEIMRDCFWHSYHFLAFHTREQCDLFLDENEDLIK